jgi:hypothetical protein
MNRVSIRPTMVSVQRDGAPRAAVDRYCREAVVSLFQF